jgi:hypothetical protein
MLNHIDVVELSTRHTTTLLMTELKSLSKPQPVDAKAAVEPARPVIAPMPRLNPPPATATPGTGGQPPATEQAAKADTTPAYTTVVKKPRKPATILSTYNKPVPNHYHLTHQWLKKRWRLGIWLIGS